MKDRLSHSFPAFPFKSVLLTFSCVGIFLLGCSLHPFQKLARNVYPDKARFYSYFILHGAAQSALGRDMLSPEQVKTLLKADDVAKRNLVKRAFEGKMEKSFAHYLLAIHPDA